MCNLQKSINFIHYYILSSKNIFTISIFINFQQMNSHAQTQIVNTSFYLQAQKYKIVVYLTQDEAASQNIKIEINHKITKNMYQLTINQKYIEQNFPLNFFYQNPQHLFNDIFLNRSKITLRQNGQILIKIQVKQKEIQILFITHKKQSCSIDSNQIKDNMLLLQNLSKQIMQLKKQNKLMVRQSVYKKNIQKIWKQISKIKQQNEITKKSIYNNNQKKKYSHIQQDNFNKAIEDSQDEKDLIQVKMQNEIDYLCSPSKMAQQNDIVSNQLQQNMQQRMLQFQRWNNKHYLSSQEDGKLAIKYITQKTQYGYLFSYSIPLGKITRLDLRQINTYKQTNDIIYGVSTDKILGISNPYKHPQCKSYYPPHRGVFQNGQLGKQGLPVDLMKDGRIISIIVDMIKQKIAWKIDEEEVISVKLSKEMLKSRLYFMLSMYSKNTKVQVENIQTYQKDDK